MSTRALALLALALVGCGAPPVVHPLRTLYASDIGHADLRVAGHEWSSDATLVKADRQEVCVRLVERRTNWRQSWELGYGRRHEPAGWIVLNTEIPRLVDHDERYIDFPDDGGRPIFPACTRGDGWQHPPVHATRAVERARLFCAPADSRRSATSKQMFQTDPWYVRVRFSYARSGPYSDGAGDIYRWDVRMPTRAQPVVDPYAGPATPPEGFLTRSDR